MGDRELESHASRGTRKSAENGDWCAIPTTTRPYGILAGAQISNAVSYCYFILPRVSIYW